MAEPVAGFGGIRLIVEDEGGRFGWVYWARTALSHALVAADSPISGCL